MKVAILTLGTQGDVLPFAHLGKAFVKAGHEVIFSSAKNFKSLADEFQLKFSPVDADFQELINSEEGKRMMKRPLQAKKNLRKFVFPMLRSALSTFYSVAAESDKVLFHGKTMADCFADQFPEKMIKANVVPAFESTKAFPNPVIGGFRIASFFNKMSYKFSDLGYRMMIEPITQFRTTNGLPKKFLKRNIPGIYGISEHFLKQPGDYPPDNYFTGFWTAPSNATLSEELKSFLNAGPAPLLLTFGSMPFRSKLDLPQTLNRLTKELNIRLVVAKGWGLHDTTEIDRNPDIHTVPYLPYDALLPFVKAAIHHGGIGTIAACLRAGKPFLSCPVLYPLGDQYFWANIAYKKHLGPKPLPLKKLTADSLVSGTRQLLSSPDFFHNAELMKTNLLEEDGLGKAVKLVEGF